MPTKCELYQAIFDKATELLNLAKDKQLVYRGEFPSQVCERLRLEVSRSTRHKWTQKECESVRIRQGCLCECGAILEPGKFHLDHITALFDGGEDSLDNIDAKCLPCHGENRRRNASEPYTGTASIRNCLGTYWKGSTTQPRLNSWSWEMARRNAP